jgi:hypothetical protein
MHQAQGIGVDILSKVSHTGTGTETGTVFFLEKNRESKSNTQLKDRYKYGTVPVPLFICRHQKPFDDC